MDPGSPRKRVRDDQRGTALIEFALILPFMLVVTMVVVDLSRAFYMKSMLTSAARDGARLAITLGNPATYPGADNQSVVDRVSQVLTPVTAVASVGLDSVSTTVTSPIASHYQVTVSGQFHWLYLGLLNFFSPGQFTNPQTLTASAVMRSVSSS